MVLPIYLYGTEILKKEAEAADLSDREALAALVGDMKETLASADGCGLAAPQVGVSKRVISRRRRGVGDLRLSQRLPPHDDQSGAAGGER